MSWFFIPVIGNFSPNSFSIKNNAGVPIARNDNALLQGAPRPGVLKWYLDLATDSPMTGDDNEIVKIVVPSPYTFTDEELSIGLNSFIPIVLVSAPTSGVYVQQVAVNAQPLLVEGVSSVLVTISLGAIQDSSLEFNLLIDFSHSLIN